MDEIEEVSEDAEIHPAEKNVRGPAIVEVAPHEKEARVHSLLCVTASQERKAADVASQGEEKEGIDADVDATRLNKSIEVSNDEESHPAEEIQQKTDELFKNDVQSNAKNVQTNAEQSNDNHANENDEQSNDDHENENDDHSKENHEVNGDKYGCFSFLRCNDTQ